MKNNKFMLIVVLSILIFGQSVFAQNLPPSAAVVRPANPNKQTAQTVTLTVGDLQTFRVIAAERDSYAKENTVLKKQCSDWEASSKDWQSQFNQATYRADVTQENRITDYRGAVTEKDKALAEKDLQLKNYATQHAADLQRNADLEFKYRKARANEWKFAAAGAGVGFAGGFYAGKTYGNTKIILTGSSGGLASNQLASFSF